MVELVDVVEGGRVKFMGGSEGKWLALSEVEVSDMSESFMLV
jgi:hypothetical protein